VWGVRGVDLGRNSLRALPPGVGRWTAITSLSVAGNGLAALHPSLGLCHTLQARPRRPFRVAHRVPLLPPPRRLSGSTGQHGAGPVPRT
jgi:hypothetical protein